MKSPFYFLFLILIFLTACKQESKKSTEQFPVSKNKNVNTPTESVPKNEKEKLAPKIDSKKPCENARNTRKASISAKRVGNFFARRQLLQVAVGKRVHACTAAAA